MSPPVRTAIISDSLLWWGQDDRSGPADNCSASPPAGESLTRATSWLRPLQPGPRPSEVEVPALDFRYPVLVVLRP